MSIKIYPVADTELSHDGYQVKLNGQFVKLDTARVSAVPLNRRWPGHQRSTEQTELCNFLSFAMDEPVSFEILPKEPFESVTVRPRSLGIEPVITEEGAIRFTLDRPAFFTVEPYGRHNALHVFADPMPDYHVEPQDRDVIFFSPGIHEVGQIELHSNQTLYLEAGAVVYACIKSIDAENIRILGRGILDNSHNKETILYEANETGNDSAVNNALRQHTIQLEYCTNVEIDGITIRDSLVYNIRPVACRDVRISNVKIIGCWRYNSDGIDMHNCENVWIENCFLRTFDDSICVKGFDCYYEGDVEQAVHDAMYRNGKRYDVFKNVRVRNCTIWNDWGKCLEIGAETRAEEIRDIVFEACSIIHVTGSVLDCCNVDYADVHDVVYRDIQVEYDDRIPEMVIQKRDSDVYRTANPDYAPALIDVRVQFHHEYSAGGARRGKNRKILFRNIHLYGRQTPIFRFGGFDAVHTCSDITIRDLYVNGKKLTKHSPYVWNENAVCRKIQLEF